MSCGSQNTHQHESQTPVTAGSNPATRAQIDQILRDHRVVLFLKGTPEQPRCKFSAGAVALMKRLNVSYHPVDVMADELVRNEIKLFSNWPTLPQLYVNQQFMGGGDQMRDLDKTGELEKLLKSV